MSYNLNTSKKEEVINFHKDMDKTLAEISDLDIFTCFNLHTDANYKSDFYVTGFKDGERKLFNIPLTKFRNRDDMFNVKLFPLFRECSYGENQEFTEIMTEKPFLQENISYNKKKELSRSFYKNQGLPFKTAFMKTKEAHLMFQTNIFKKDVDLRSVDSKLLDMCFFDIETSAGRIDELGGEKVGSPFDNMLNQKNKVRVITTYSTKRDKFYVFAYKDFDVEKIRSMISDNVYYDEDVKQDVKDRFDSIKDKIVKIKVKDEADLLLKFISHLRDGYDALVGWNSAGFDLQFIVSRIRIVLGEAYVNKLSPFNSVELREKENGKGWYIDIAGLPHIDLLDMYKVFNFEPRMDYTLSNIMQCEAGIDKIEKPTDSFDDFYRDDYDTYVLYNIQDVNGLHEIDIATEFIYMALLQAVESKINIVDAYSKTTLHTFAMIDKMRKEGKVYANDVITRDSFSYEGGFVQAIQGVYHFLKSRDFTSLYPTNIIEFNMSIETLFHKKDYAEMVAKIGEENIISTLNPDVFFRKDKMGIMASYALNDFNKRNEYKREMKKHEYGSLEYTQNNRFQHLQKIKINSLYGANGADHWYFSSYYIADTITMTGRHLITTMEKVLIDTNTNVGLLSKEYNQNIYNLTHNGETFKVYGDTMVKVNRNNDIADIMVDNMNETDEFISIAA